MPLLKDLKYIENDWIESSTEDLPLEGKIIVSLEQFIENKNLYLSRNGSLGLRIPNDFDVFELQNVLENIDLIVVQYPVFSDGRAYSQARQLRSELSFEGEIRAQGNILPDQIGFMRQCGINSFEVDDRFPEDIWQRILSDMSLSYQEDYLPVSGQAPATILAKRKHARQSRG